jgi:hypothetical protein
MDPGIARIVVIGIAAVGAIVWIEALAAMFRASRERQSRIQLAGERFDVDGPQTGSTIVGEVELQGKPDDLSAKLASQLARDGLGPIGPVKILACDRNEISFEAAGPAAASGQSQPGMMIRRGRFRLEAFGSRTRVAYAIETSSGRLLLMFGWTFVVLGLAALVAGVWLLLTLVVASPSAAVRAQSVQMVQAIHFLWPPFLFAHLARQPAKLVRSRVDSLINNLPYI